MNDREIHVTSPTAFIGANWGRLLPGWPMPPRSMVLVLLRARLPLDGENASIEAEKDRCLARYLQEGERFQSAGLRAGWRTEIISPRDGTPRDSTGGEIGFDLVAIVHEVLKFDFSQTRDGCKVLNHPFWGTRVYPGLFLAEAEPSIVDSLAWENA